MSANVILPRVMQVGAEAIKALPSILQSISATKILIITDKTMLQLGYVEQIQTLLIEANIGADVYADTIPEPTVASIDAAVSVAVTGQYDCIIALGGGSAIDSAKAVAILAKYGGEMRDYKFPRIVAEQGIPLIAIPTTAGTGSEVTRFTIITDDSLDNDEKMLCVGMGFMPFAALVDYELTLSLPPRITADTGIDALTHAIEAYVSQKANPYSDSQALAAMHLIGPSLRQAYHHGDDRHAREALMLGSTLAGIAFSNASVALVHGMSRPIGAFFHVPHGLSNAMLLPIVTEFSMSHARGKYAQCARAIGVASNVDSDEQACRLLVAELHQLNQELSVPTPAEFGIDKQQFMALLETMSEQAFASGSPANNPRVPDKQQMIRLYQSLWVGQ